MPHSKTQELIKSLQNPALYPHQTDSFKIIETHISWVILTGAYAYKIKKPLDLGFLDFSTLEKRHHYCREELRLNSRLAPDIYLDVVTISGSKKKPQINHAGEVFEYAVKMRQFDPDNTFDHLLAKQQLTAYHLKQTAKIIADFHNRIAQAASKTEFGTPETVMQPVRENFHQIQQLHDIEKPDILQQLAGWSEQEYIHNQDLFKQRKHSGFIRECHGDLHLANITLIDDQIVPFDGIEFNPSLYWIDVISEVAFLSMDLTGKKRPDLAFQFLNEYLHHSGDYEGLKLLRFYQVYRAMVRAKVSAIRASQATGEGQQRATEDYRSYLHLAQQYTQDKKPIMLMMHGVSASGKSWLSGQIIEHFPAIRIRSDVERKRLFQLSAQKESQADINQGLYSAQITAQTYQQLLQLAREILTAGYSVIVDATFLKQQQRQPFLQLAEQISTPFRIVHTYADEQILLRRIQQRPSQQDNVSDADQQVLTHQLQSLEPLTDLEQQKTIAINTSQSAQLTKLWNFLDNSCEL